jgi:hypothetical protein
MNDDDEAAPTRIDLLRRPPEPDADALLADTDLALPVVARIIVEIRSDGRRTLARGQLEDLITGERTAIAARGDSPAALLASLLRSVTGIATLVRRAARALAPRRRP